MLKQSQMSGVARTPMAGWSKQAWLAAALVALLGLSACGDKKSAKPGQALASVNGEEITMLQLNEEMQRANVQAAQQEAASAQILESLIDRQLVLNEAIKDKVDRDPKVVQAIERAKAMLIAQAYVQKKVGAQARPARADVEAYYQKNPALFGERKLFELRQLVMASKDVTPEVKRAIDGVKTLDEAAAWMDQHKLRYNRAQLARTSADLPPQLSSKLIGLPKGQLFMINEGERSMLLSITDIKDAPATLEQAAPQIEQFLLNKKNKDAADAEVARLRGGAKIEYLNGRKAPAAGAPAAAKGEPDERNARGVAGLK